jgi:hypothetical protein
VLSYLVRMAMAGSPTSPKRQRGLALAGASG